MGAIYNSTVNIRNELRALVPEEQGLGGVAEVFTFFQQMDSHKLLPMELGTPIDSNKPSPLLQTLIGGVCESLGFADHRLKSTELKKMFCYQLAV